MGDIFIRLDNAVAARLSARAKGAGRSLEDEVRAVLEDATAAGAEQREQRAFIKRLKRLRQDFFNDHLAPGAVARFVDAHKAAPKPQKRRRALSTI